MSQLNRRDFLKHSTLATAVSATGLSINAAGANERVVIGGMGTGGRGNFLLQEFAKRKDVEIRFLADPDSNRHAKVAKNIESITGAAPACFQDVRKILEDKEVDGIINATPDHWHALGTIWACQAGKDVYVEKPTSHSIWESRKMVEAARNHKRIVQVGAQNRSAEYNQRAFEYLRSGDFGDIHYLRVLNSKQRGPIGKKPDGTAPAGVDYDLWLGPAPARPFNPNRFHYCWHWFWDFSGGDIINDGVHQVDIARWMIDRDYPKSVVSGGGMNYFDDDQETPDTHTVTWDYGDLTVQFEQTLWTPYMRKTPLDLRDTDSLPNWPFSGTRMEIYGTKQMMFLSRHGGGWQAFDAEGKSVAIQPGRFSPSNTAHIGNFIDCIRSRELPNGDIEKLHLSTLLCHYGNIAWRTKQYLEIDPATEGFKNNEAANALVKRTYREPYSIPDQV